MEELFKLVNDYRNEQNQIENEFKPFFKSYIGDTEIYAIELLLIEKQSYKDKIEDLIKEHQNARNLAAEQLTTTQVVADSDSLNYGRIQAHNFAIKKLKKLLGENR